MVLTLTDDLNVRHIVRLKQLLQQSLAESDQLIVDLTEAKGVDAAFLQLLSALQAAADRQRKAFTLRVADDPASPFRQACRALGLERICPD